MIILGIADSHESHACILVNGKLVSAIAEERLSRLKTDSSYPRRAINKVIKDSGVRSNQIDLVVFAGKDNLPYLKILREAALFSVADWIKLQDEYWKPKLYLRAKLDEVDRFSLFEDKVKKYSRSDPYYDFIKIDPKTTKAKRIIAFNKFRAEIVQKHLGIDAQKVKFLRHEDCHKYYGIYSSPKLIKNSLVFTCEGGGDDSSATVSVFKENKIKELWSSNAVNIGRLYAYTTLVLGMKPNQHEYKVMGLAPYSNKEHGKKALNFFRSIEKNQGTKIIPNSKFTDLYFHTLDSLRAERFDNIAWGLQEFLEEIIEKWVCNNIKQYKINNVVFSGGVGQNIKLMRKLMLNPIIKNLWAGPISGDGSLAIGAVWFAAKKFSQDKVKGLSSIYLGSSYTSDQVDKYINNYKFKVAHKVIKNPNAKIIAKWLVSGKIIGRFSGKMEFGQRALGNRSILADPRTFNSVTKINNVIKKRDFWMPFTPSVLNEYSRKLINNEKNVYSPFMTMAFNTNTKYLEKLPAVIHPSDKTMRPQMLKRKDNQEYYDIIKEFFNLTGIPAVLNTSFNLHGEPIVESPKDALSTFERSDLDILLFDKIAIIKSKKI